MFKFFRRIWQGAGYLEGYGRHPGTEIFVVMIIIFGLAGANNGWTGFVGGLLFGFVLLGIPYACGCYSRTKDYERDVEITVEKLRKDYCDAHKKY